MSDDNEWKKAPTEEKVEHKNWKARLEGYEECLKLFRLCDDPKSPVVLNYLGLVKKFVVDSNEVAKEKALEATLAFVENVPAASKTVGEVVPGLIAKCLNARPKTREKAIEIILMYIEAEKQEIVQEELVKGLENKQPKVVQSCLEILRRAINEFGSKVMPIKPIIKFVPKLLEDRDKTVRDETKLLAVEMYRWAGAAIMPQLQGIKPVLLQELEDEFKTLAASGEKPRQTRFLRSQQDLKAKMEAEAEARAMNGAGASAGGDAGADGAADGAEAAPEAVDPYDLMEPADLLSKLPKDFKEKIEAKKWQERKEVLDNLIAVLQKNPRLQPVDYYELVNDLKKMVAKDANVNIVIAAAKCITGIASGLRKDFAKYALLALEPLMERFKEKKQNIVDALREACDAIYPSTNLEAISEMCVTFLGHKTPVVRQQVALFLARCFAMSTQTTLPKKVLKIYLPPLLKNLTEADPSVRESSSEALGAIYKTLGEKIFMPQVGELEPAKLDKIKEFADKCVLLNLRGEPRAGAVVSAPKPAAAAAAPAAPATAAKKPTIVKPSEAAQKPEAKTANSAAGPKKVVKGGGGGGASSAAAAKKDPLALPDEPDLSPDVVEERAAEIFGAEVVAALANANWKERQQAIETLTAHIKRMPTDEVPVQIVVRTVAKKPGFKDSHFQVLKQRLELVAMLADTGFKFTQRSAGYCLVDIADKIGDVKTAQQAKDALSKIAEACSLPLVISHILPPIFEGKNPKNQEHALVWLATAIREFGFTGVDMKLLLTHIRASLANSNATVRSGAIQLIATVYLYAGPQFRALFDQEKAALLEQIDAEIDKVKGQKPPVPVRGRNVPGANGGAGGAAGDDESAGGGADEEVNEQAAQEALFPRVDISAQLNDALMDQLNDKNWKERQAALEKLEGILRENKFIEPNLNELPTHLNKRLNDTNKILATTALRLSEKLAQALGTQGKRYVSVLAPGMIQALSDNKEALRKTAVSALNAWFDSCGGLVPFIEGELLAEALAGATNPNIKAELCGWLASVLPKAKPGKLPPELKAIIGSVYAFVEDRNPDVRAQAQELIAPLMMHVGANEMLRVMQKAKPTSVTILQPLIEKARAEVAAKQPPKPAPAAAPAREPTGVKSGAKPPAAKSLYDDSDESAADAAPPPPAAKKEPAKVNGAGKGKETKAEPAKPAAPASKKKGAEDEDLSPPLQVSNKNKRIDEEKALKTLKWNFEAPRREFIDQLRAQMEAAAFNRTLVTQLFHDDFKFHIVALATLTKAIEDSEATISNLDLVLRWLTLRFFETNPTVILKAIEYMQALFGMLAGRGHHLLDYEAAAFVPYFITKLGDPKDPIRKGFRAIVKQITQVYAPVKIFNYLIAGLVSKNARQRAECLEELGQMIEALGLAPFNPSVTLKEIAKQIGDRDTSVRNAALNTITVAFQIAGEQVYKYVGKLNEKDQSMLDERIKRSKPGPGVKASASGSLSQHTGAATSATAAMQAQSQVPSSASLSAIASLGQQAATNGHGSTTNLNEDKPSRPLARPAPTPKKNALPPPMPTSAVKAKGEFSLDLKDDDDDAGGIVPVKLTPHQDLDELLNQPIGLPPRKNVTSYPSNILKESQDCREAIDLVITHISHQNIDISFQNLVQIDVVIKDREKRDFLIPHVDNLLNTCAIKLNVAHNIYLNSHDCQVDEVFRLFKGLFTVIIDIFENNLGKFATVKSLKDVIYNLLCVMIDSKICNYADGDQLIKAINMVTLKLLELSNQTTIYCALVRLLIESCDQETFSSKYIELVMKCIWRLIRRLSMPNNETLVAQIDTSKILAEIHAFLKMYPTISWQSKQSDLPLRTVKTLLFHLAKAKQAQILDDLNAIQAPDDSEIKTYITKLFRSGFQIPGGAGGSANGSFAAKSSQLLDNMDSISPEKPTGQPMSRQLSDQLAVIVKKISAAETSKEGLRELYDFKHAHPDVEWAKYFKNSTGKLYTYIQENLKKIEAERNGNGNGGGSRLPTSFKNDLIAKKENCSPEKTMGDALFKPATGSSSSSSSRNVDDIMKTIADWKSKTHLNKLDDEETADSTFKISSSGGGGGVGSSVLLNGNGGAGGDYKNTRLYQYYQNQSGGGGGVSGSTAQTTSATRSPPSSQEAERYLDIVKDLKKKYTRSRTEVDQLNDLKQLDLKAKGYNENSMSSNSITPASGVGGQVKQEPTSSGGTESQSTAYAQMSSESLYDEYKRRLELIKKFKPVN